MTVFKSHKLYFILIFNYIDISLRQFCSPDGFLFIAAMSDVEEEYEWVDQHPSQLITRLFHFKCIDFDVNC